MVPAGLALLIAQGTVKASEARALQASEARALQAADTDQGTTELDSGREGSPDNSDPETNL